MTEHDKVTKAKAAMVGTQPFFAVIALGLPFIEDESLDPPTMATDMTHIYYHPKFIDECSRAEVEGTIAHEVLHVANLHGMRRGTRDPFLWNVACDFAINPIVLDAGYKLPKGALVDNKYRGMSAEAIYEDILKNPPPNLKFVNFGGVLDANGTQAEKSAREQEIKITVKSAAERAKQIGKLPGGLEGLIEAVGKPKINWQDYIPSWIKSVLPDDYTWALPNKWMLTNHRFYMPTITMTGAGIGVLSLDTSGSVSDSELVSFVTEIVGLIEGCKPEKLYIIQHDAEIQKEEIWEVGMDFTSLKVKGRGGTRIRPTFKRLDEIIEEEGRVDWLILFTDCEIGDWPTVWPDVPTLIAATGKNTLPDKSVATYIPIKDAI